MAKRKRDDADDTSGAGDLLGAVPEKMRKEAMGWKKRLTSYFETFGTMRAKAEEIAQPVIALFNELKGAIAKKRPDVVFGLADFVRLYDASVPEHRGVKDGKDGYAKHQSYMAVAYLQRVQQGTKKKGQQGKVDLKLAKFERVMKMIEQIIAPESRDVLWSATLRDELGIADRGWKIIQNRVHDDACKPLFDLTGIIKTPIRLSPDLIQVAEHTATPAAQTESAAAVALRNVARGALAQMGQRVKLAAAKGGRRKAAA